MISMHRMINYYTYRRTFFKFTAATIPFYWSNPGTTVKRFFRLTVLFSIGFHVTYPPTTARKSKGTKKNNSTFTTLQIIFSVLPRYKSSEKNDSQNSGHVCVQCSHQRVS